MKIHYINNYVEADSSRKVFFSASTNNKVQYICSVLEQNGLNVSVFSTAMGNHECIWEKRSKGRINEHVRVYYSATCGRSNVIAKFIQRLILAIELLNYLFFSVDKDDILLVYHSLIYKYPLFIFRKFRKNRLVLEVEEIFSAILKHDADINREIVYVRKIADAYILVNDLLKNKCSIDKPSIVCYGNYTSYISKKEKKPIDKIHVVYGGLIGGIYSDVYMALELAKYLSSDYMIHVAGYGSKSDIVDVEKKIEEINNQLGYTAIIYEGCLSSLEFSYLLQKSHFGLCVKESDMDIFSDYYFPSKIIFYLINNVVPICSKIRSVEFSQFSKDVIFIDENSPSLIAEKIKNTSMNICMSERFVKLNIDFVKGINEIILSK